MRVLFVASELYPLVKTGGLADVCAALPPALAALGAEVRVLLPRYPAVREGLPGAEPVAELPDLFGGAGRVLAGRLADGTTVLALDAAALYDRPGNPYLGPDRRDWPDNHLRFAALAWTAAEIGRGLLDWRPDVVHGHDWQAGLTAAYLRFAEGKRPATVMTVHNLAFQGLFPVYRINELRLPLASFDAAGIEFYGQIGYLKAGLAYSDRITTVSPTYAREIRTPEGGLGLDGLLRYRAGDLTGILNGIDTDTWNPATDGNLAATYDADHLDGKAVNKQALQRRLGLAEAPEAPLFCVVSRLTRQKGLDLIPDALPQILRGGGQLAVLGTGDGDLEAAFVAAAAANPGRVAAAITYDEALSHLMQGGADAILVPSRFEPCGLTQLYGLRYGTLPIVARVGGLADSVIDANTVALADGVATGFTFAPVVDVALAEALERAFDLYADRSAWQRVQRRAMSREVGWSRAAQDYMTLYRELTG